MRNRGPAASSTDVARQVAEQCLRLWQPDFASDRSVPDLPGMLRKAGITDTPSAVLTAGLPWLSRTCSDRWIGRRLIWWPRGIPELRRIAIVSSRLSRRLDQEHRWFDLLRTAMIRVDPEQEAVSVVAGTAVAEIVSRAAGILQKPTIRFRLSPEADPLSGAAIVDWISQRLSSAGGPGFPSATNTSHPFPGSRGASGLTAADLAEDPMENPSEDLVWPAEVSPQLCPDLPRVGDVRNDVASAQLPLSGLPPAELPPAELPLADRLLFASASRVCVLWRRRGGHVESLIRHHVLDGDRGEALVFVAEDLGGISEWKPTAVQRTVVRWIVQSSVADAAPVASSLGTSVAAGDSPDDPSGVSRERPDLTEGFWRSDSGPLRQPAEWLLHWTRPRPGPWPDQSREDWMDELILGCQTADRSAFACLLRIVGERRLRASSEGIRGGYSVISFTEVPLEEFRARRVFRGHRHRFDFEPWGIAIRRDALQRLGARAVIYGHDADWQELPAAERPFFQKAADDRSATDNRAEREWRLCRDLSFAEISEADWCLFVDTAAAAAALSRDVSCEVIVVPK